MGILEPSRSETPVQVGPVSVAAILLRGGKASIDHGALHGRSQVEAGKKPQSEPPPPDAERIAVVWVAIKSGAFYGIACSAIFKAGDSVYRDTVAQSNAIAAAARGEFDAAALAPAEKAVLRGFLHSCEPVLWDAAPAGFKSALRSAV